MSCAHPGMKENKDLACYFVTKHSWRGKYKRIFSIGTMGITTYNPLSREITNQWLYSEIINMAPNVKAPTNNEFILTMKRGPKKVDTMRFSTEHRADVLTEALRFSHQFCDRDGKNKRFNASKYHWSENRVPVILRVSPGSLDQLDPATGRRLCSYDYKDMEGLSQVSDYPGGLAVIYGGFSRLHLFALEQMDELVKAVQGSAANDVGVSIKLRKEPILLDQFLEHKFGKYSSDEALTSYAEFTVQKLNSRGGTDSIRRTLCLSETCLLERDPGTYNIVTVRPLCDVFALVRDQENPQRFTVEYVKGAVRTYASTDRDALLASILDGVRASGNRDVCVKMAATDRGQRLGPFTVPVDEEVETQHMKFLQSPPDGLTFSEAVSRFNANIPYCGLLHAVTQEGLFAENKERMIHATLSALLDRQGDQSKIGSEDLEAQFQAIRRLVASKAGFQAFTVLPKMRESVGIKVVKALKRNDDGVTHAAVDMLNALMQPMHDDYDLAREQLNKASLMSSKTFMENLLNVLKTHVVRGSGALVISVMLDFLTFALCAPYSETTDGAYFDNLLEMVAGDGRIIYRLFEHPSMAIVKGAGLVMKAIIEEGETEIASRMQDLSLAEGALPRHLHIAMFTQTTDSRMLTNRQLSRHLVGLWVTGHSTATSLLKRILPGGLMSYLESTDDVPDDDHDRINVRDNLVMAQEHHSRNKRNPHLRKIERMIEKKVEYVMIHWRERIGLERKQLAASEKPIVLRKRRQKIKSEANWKLFYYYFNKDHSKPNLIWNFKTREELRECLEQEMRSFTNDKDLGGHSIISWNHDEFEVPYNCLAEEIRIGEYYLRLLMEEDQNEEVTAIKRSPEFFNDLYHRFLLTPKLPMKCMCLQTMAIVYGRCYEEIGPFNDTKFIVGMLDRCMDRLERDRLIIFISKLVLHKRNAKELIDAKGLRSLVDLLTLAHLHVQRAHAPLQSNVIEAAPDMKSDGEREWYYGNQAKERLGPYSFAEIKALYVEGKVTAKSRCWSQGMDGWRPLITVPQLKWALLASSQAVLNESELSILVMNIMIKVCEYYPSRDSDNAVIRPLPRAKRDLSEPICLPHIVQLLLTFDPVLVEKVATLLNEIMVDNPSVTRAYLTGVFFFIMMYTGSNVLPIVRFLKYAHLEQAFRADEYKSNDVMSRSILSHILPDAMVHFLENHTAEKFAEIFLGEFDTPEAIWSREMRRMMIEKIASHLADFSPRLPSNTRALYQYCPIPLIVYPQLENELFCNIYYLRHLCDTVKFPDWPIAEPVKLLKDILEAWKKEVEKKPPDITIQEAYDVLGIKAAQKDVNESSVRKAYFKVAQKYHPDKNPDGREMFERVNKAYEFLCSRSRLSDGPDPQNILLIIKAQCILFHRYRDILHPYKYSGYPMLIKTIRLETADEHLFGKKVPLLSASSELCYHTVNCSALNAEELRRENGIEALQAAFSRCISIISRSTKSEELCVQVCREVVRCYTVAAQFEGCRERILEQPNITKDVCRTLYFRQLKKMCVSVAECVGAFAVDFWLQTNLFQAGVLWHLIPLLFAYDFTLEESGVSSSEDSNEQEVSNRLAKLSLVAITRLAGFSPTQTSPSRQAAPATPAQSPETPSTPPQAPVETPAARTPLTPVQTPDNPAVQKSVTALLTTFLSRKMANYEIEEVLKTLTSNTESPYLLWNNGTRGELLNFVEDQLQNVLGDADPSFGAEFVFSDHSKELIIGDIFVRIYNEQPAFPLENPKGFAIDLLQYLGSQAQYLHSLVSLNSNGDLMSSPNLMTSPNLTMKSQAPDCQNRLVAVKMALEALRNVINANPGVEIQCIGHFKLLFSLLRLTGCCDIQQCALEVISVVSKNQECVSDISASDVLVYLLLALQTLPSSQLLTLETLYPLISNTKIVKEALNKGALIYLLDLFCNATDPGVREQSAEVFTKILSDKLVGPKVRIILSKFLPTIFMDAMRDNAQASVHMFEGTHENPELIWNDDSREKVSLLVRRMKENHFQKQCENADVRWHLPEDFAVVYTDIAGELVVGGVYLRLFIASPGWVLRRPKEFMVELLDRWMTLASTSNPHIEILETVSSALGSLFRAQPALLDQMPQLGHLPRFFQAMSSRNGHVIINAVSLVREVTENKTCLRCMASIECIGPLKVAMQQSRECISKACEALHNLFNTGDDELVQQALKVDLVGHLLELLNGRLDVLENPAATKAQIVKALKAMQKSLQYGQEICNLLAKSSVWNEYKDQKHDLFISNTPVAGYLTNAPGVAGYLTAASNQSRNLPTSPPPVDKEF